MKMFGTLVFPKSKLTTIKGNAQTRARSVWLAHGGTRHVLATVRLEPLLRGQANAVAGRCAVGAKDKLLCDDVIETLVVFSEAHWVGTYAVLTISSEGVEAH
jgi:hypothetical protein